MSFPISLDNPSSPPPLRRQIKKFKKKESKEVKKKVVSLNVKCTGSSQEAASRGRLPAVKYRHGQVPSVASASQKQGK
jgi:hypothetical protein